MKNKFFAALAATTILACIQPAAVHAQNTPAFRVPIGADATNSNVPDTYAWLQQVGNCSTTCGTGTRTTSYQCQNIADYDYSGSGYGLPEADAMCTASVGAKPANSSEACTVYSGCGYDWVKPAVQQTVKPWGSNPLGRIGCGFVNQKFSPYCQRTGGGSNLTLPSGDYRFCSGDRPDYDDVAAGNPDALGYDRDGKQLASCNATDHDWTAAEWSGWSSTCSTTAMRTRAVTCTRRFDAEPVADAACGTGRPAASETAAVYSSCSYTASYGGWSSCSGGTQTQTMTSCTRSDGASVAGSYCNGAGYPTTRSQSCAVTLNTAWCQGQKTVWNNQTFNWQNSDPTNPTSYNIVPNTYFVSGGVNHFTSASWSYTDLGNGTRFCQAAIGAYNAICTVGVDGSGNVTSRGCTDIPASPW